MKIYLSSVIGKKVMPQDNRIGGGYEDLSCRDNVKTLVIEGAEIMNIYLAGGISGNLLALCKTMRGAKKKGKMSCCFLTGAFKDNADTKAEFLAACRETA